AGHPRAPRWAAPGDVRRSGETPLAEALGHAYAVRAVGERHFHGAVRVHVERRRAADFGAFGIDRDVRDVRRVDVELVRCGRGRSRSPGFLFPRERKRTEHPAFEYAR